MPLFLYKVRKAHRWYSESAREFLENDDVPADAVGDMQTKANLLSVWEVAQNRSDVVRIVRAIAVGADRIDDAGYVLLDSNHLMRVGIEVVFLGHASQFVRILPTAVEAPFGRTLRRLWE